MPMTQHKMNKSTLIYYNLINQISDFHVKNPKVGDLLTYMFDSNIYEEGDRPVYMILNITKKETGATYAHILCVGKKIHNEVYGAQIMGDGQYLNNYVRLEDSKKALGTFDKSTILGYRT